MHKLHACPVLELMPEFARTVQRHYDLNDATFEAGLSEGERKRREREEGHERERMLALEGLIMKTPAASELGRTLQLTLAHADLDTLYSWTIKSGDEEFWAQESKARLSGMLASMMRGRDISQIPSIIREVYLGRPSGDEWVADQGDRIGVLQAHAGSLLPKDPSVVVGPKAS